MYVNMDEKEYKKLQLEEQHPVIISRGEEFHLDSLGEWNQIKIKIQHNATNGSDDITILERSVITYALTYQDEV